MGRHLVDILLSSKESTAIINFMILLCKFFGIYNEENDIYTELKIAEDSKYFITNRYNTLRSLQLDDQKQQRNVTSYYHRRYRAKQYECFKIAENMAEDSSNSITIHIHVLLSTKDTTKDCYQLSCCYEIYHKFAIY